MGFGERCEDADEDFGEFLSPNSFFYPDSCTDLSALETTPVLMLSPTSPFLTPPSLLNSIAEQRCPAGTSFLTCESNHFESNIQPTVHWLRLALPYPAICLLIASVHTQTAGHDTFTFEMLHQLFRDQVRISIAAPVQIEGGGSIGMVKCGRQVMMGVSSKNNLPTF